MITLANGLDRLLPASKVCTFHETMLRIAGAGGVLTVTVWSLSSDIDPCTVDVAALACFKHTA
ncbi:hypothetical protein [Pseudomonas sp. efr-133-TYG-5]|uniref:hypothetical protein n=1 Tax=Pseudomonas sp. efr-133-TYG-5 TaxID=3040310 RepID=UPI002553B483|nr:hypothetical protein [Pseudomonas sp. efr-133-TYG-5]